MRSDSEVLADVERKIDTMKDNIHSIEKSQIDMKKDLSYHIKRTDLLQGEVMHLSERMKPIESIRLTWQNMFKLITFFTAICTLATGFFACMKYFGVIGN